MERRRILILAVWWVSLAAVADGIDSGRHDRAAEIAATQMANQHQHVTIVSSSVAPIAQDTITTTTTTEPPTTEVATELIQETTTAQNEEYFADGSGSTTEEVEESTTVKEQVTSRPSAVGRALSQDGVPEAKSTKVIGTMIIEDIHGPFIDGVTSSVNLDGGGIAAIVLCTFLVLVTTVGASGYWWYRRRYLVNRPETLSERYAPSETGLGAAEDIFRVGYVHSPELPRQDSSEEMYSLDNDSFLTSLEAMTIPTYWTETIKHTKL